MTAVVDEILVHSFTEGFFEFENRFLPIAHENAQYNSQGGQPYAELTVLQGDIDPYTLTDENITTGVMNCLLRFAENTGAIPAKQLAERILEYYWPGRRFFHPSRDDLSLEPRQINGRDVSAQITSGSRLFNRNEDGWYQILVQISYIARFPRVVT